MCWRIGRVEAFRLEDHGFESRSSRHAETLGKSLCSYLWRETLAQYPCCVGSASE